MRRHVIGIALGLSAPFFLSSVTLAAQAPTTADFVNTVAMSDMFEIQSGQLAAEKAENGDVKSFGQEMVDDHSKTSDQLKDLVKDEDIKAQLPAALDDKHQAKIDKLKGLSGKQFDKAYVDMQVKAHEKAVSLFEAYAAAGENDDLKDWAGDTVPTLREHLKEAQDLNAKVDQVAEANDTDKTDDRAMRDDNAMAMNDDDRKNAMAMNDDDRKNAEAKPVQKSNIKYVTRQAPSDWTAEALIGRTVENENGDNLGEINNVIINEKGDVVAVVIGVGGFLGIGEKNVGVPFDELDFKTAEAMKDRTAETRDEKAERKEEAKQARFDTEHSDIRIVLNTTKEDLEAAPAFAWLDEQNSDNAKRERVVQ
jgi:putative membrane protein